MTPATFKPSLADVTRLVRACRQEAEYWRKKKAPTTSRLLERAANYLEALNAKPKRSTT